MIPEGTDNHIADSKADAENEDYKYQAKALSAIKKGLEISVFELYEQNSKLQSTIEEKDKEIEELKQKVSDLTFDNMTYEYNETEGNEVWPQIEEQIREDERQKLQEEKDNEIERLKGLIEDAHEAGYNDGTFNNDMTISESWEQFKEANPF